LFHHWEWQKLNAVTVVKPCDRPKGEVLSEGSTRRRFPHSKSYVIPPIKDVPGQKNYGFLLEKGDGIPQNKSLAAH
jgi:hypothetical protein